MRAETAPIQHLFYIPKRVSQRIFALKKYRKSTEKAKKNASSVDRNIDIRAELPIYATAVLEAARRMVWCRMKRRFTLLGYGIAAALAVGCESIPGIESYSPLEYGSEAKCRTTSSCPSDTVCIAGRCASASGAPYDVALKLTYPDAVDKPFTRYLEFTPGESLGAFELPDPVVGNLSVWYEGRQVEGTATFTQHGAWNGAENAQSFVFSAQKSDFSIYPAVYDIVFTPAQSEGRVFPTMVFDSIEVDNAHSDLVFQIVHDLDSPLAPSSAPVPSSHAMTWWAGLFTVSYTWGKRASNSDENTDDKGDADAFHPQIAFRITDTKQSASVAQIVLDLSPGEIKHFNSIDMSLPPQRVESTRDYRITALYQMTPTLQMEEVLGTFELSVNGVENVSVKEVVLRPFASRKFVGQLMPPSATNPANAIVSVSAVDEAGNIQWKSTAHAPTSSDGYFTFDYPANSCTSDNCNVTYTVHVSYEDEHVLASESFVFDDLEALKNIDVTPKTPVSGIVYAEDDATPLSGVTVSFTPLKAESSRTIEVVTDRDGRYNVNLNHRHYDVELIPNRTRGVSIAFDTLRVDSSNPITRDFSFERSNLIFGTCNDDVQSPVSDVRADVYIRSKSGAVRKVASSATDDKGIFRLFVPEHSDDLQISSGIF